ncbi:MAG TPA: hypothetical protein GX497_02945 [Bacillus bacterium]|nr:hypothetical protein [Bacillus sp. (in: firmicutes)]
MDNKIYRDIDNVKAFTKAFLNKLESLNIIEYYSNFFKEKLSSDYYSFSDIDANLAIFLSELLFEGNSKAYLYRWGAGVFVYDENEDSLIAKMDRLGLELGKKNQRAFLCFLKVNVPNQYQALYKLNGKVRFFQDHNDARTILEEELTGTFSGEIDEFFTSDMNLQIALIELEAMDEEAAIHKTRKHLLSRLTLINLDSKLKNYIPSIKKDVVLLDKRSSNASLKSDGEELGIKIARNSEYLQILFSDNEDEYKTLNRLMGWLRVVQDSPKETALVAIWSMLELLFVHENRDKNKSVIKQAIPYISHFYAKSIAIKVLKILKKHETQYEIIKKGIEDKYGSNSIGRNRNIKLEYFLYYIKKYERDVLELYSDFLMEQRYILFINSFTTVKKEKKKHPTLHLKEYILELEDRIRTDLLRAYRIRNILAHEASVNAIFFDDVYWKMVFYLQIILDDILFSINKQNKNTIEQMVMIKEESYLLYMNFLDSLAKDLQDRKDLQKKEVTGQVKDVSEDEKEQKEKNIEIYDAQRDMKQLTKFKALVDTKNLLI